MGPRGTTASDFDAGKKSFFYKSWMIRKIAGFLTLYHLPTCRCAYYETCATYGLNVERVFQDGDFTF